MLSKKYIIVLLLALSSVVQAQYKLVGPLLVKPGTSATYYIYNGTSVCSNCTGGWTAVYPITSQTSNYCSFNAPVFTSPDDFSLGFVNHNSGTGQQNVSIQFLIGNNYLQQRSQIVERGKTGSVAFNSYIKDNKDITAIQWQQSSDKTNWSNITSTGTTTLSVPCPASGSVNYRCSFYYNNQNFITEASEVVAEGYENRNYTRTNNVLIPGITQSDAVFDLPIGQRFQAMSYTDGLGRQIEGTSKSSSLATGGQAIDLVTFSAFDEVGRQTNAYLPFATNMSPGSYKDNPASLQASYISQKYNDATGYGKTVYENSPLNRVTKTMLPGNSWTGNSVGISYNYDYNNLNEQVKIWRIGYNETDIPYIAGNYAANTLIKNTVTDEKGKKSVSYKDLAGNTILTKVQDKEIGQGLDESGYAGWVCTYYVYDDFGRQRYIITAKAVTLLSNNNWNTGVLGDAWSELCYWYVYDDRGRSVLQHTPGGGETESVYDIRNRTVFSRDASDAQKGRWMTTLYDVLDRPNVTGFIQSGLDRNALQQQAALNTPAPVIINAGVTTLAAQTDLILTNRAPGVREYVVSNTITFETGFESEAAAEFETLVDNRPANTGMQVTVLGSPMPQGAALTTLSVNYYDSYAYTGAKDFSSAYAFATTSNANVQPTQATKRTLNMVTGQQLRIIDDEDYSNDGFLTTTVYADEKGRSLQTLADNYLKGVDISTNQYDFAGKLLNNCLEQTVPNTVIQKMRIGTAYEFDVLGRVTSISKSYNNQAYKKLIGYTYDDLGQVTKQTLSPDYNGGQGLENLVYDYNIQGWLTAINRNYLFNNGNAKYDNYFGEILGYENKDGLFKQVAEYNGNLSGAAWRTQSDYLTRRYEYNYTNTGYLAKATFGQHISTVLSTTGTDKMDASMPLVQYDDNGNLTRMQQRGVRAGQTTTVLIDDLTYSYDKGGNSNRLYAVNDAAVNLTATGTGELDFSNGTNLPAKHYDYDVAGNLVMDLNKGISAEASSGAGIVYNVLNKPYKTTVQGKFLLEYVYDAGGTLLARKVTNTAVNPTVSKWQYYVDGLVLENTTPQYFVNEAGRLRVSAVNGFANTPAPALIIGGNNGLMIGDKPAFYDFYVSDHQGNTRMILTEEEHTEYHLATEEISNDAQRQYEENMFGQPGSANEVIATRADMPPGWTSHYNDANNKKASKLNQSSPMGPNVLLKVMGGDILNMRTDYFYYEAPGNSNNGVGTVAIALIGAFSGNPSTAGMGKEVAGLLQRQLVSGADFLNFLNNINTTSANLGIPNAGLTYLFFDENFNFIPFDPSTQTGSNGSRTYTPGDGQSITIANIKAPKNGYVYIYVNNQSAANVWFDNFAVTHQRGRILQEHHYYPYGLQIAGISGKAFGKMDNGYRYQGTYSEFEEETGFTNFDLRSYDAQLGRWTSIDPYDQYASGYMGMGNNPVNGVDEDGGWSAGLTGMAVGAVAGGVSGYMIAKNNGGNVWSSLGAGFGGAFVGAGLGHAVGSAIAGNNFMKSLQAGYMGLLGLKGEGLDGEWLYSGNKIIEGDPIHIPQLYDGLDITLPSLNIKLPKLFEWVDEGYFDVFKAVGDPINILVMSDYLTGKYLSKMMSPDPDITFFSASRSINVPSGSNNTLVIQPNKPPESQDENRVIVNGKEFPVGVFPVSEGENLDITTEPKIQINKILIERKERERQIRQSGKPFEFHRTEYPGVDIFLQKNQKIQYKKRRLKILKIKTITSKTRVG
ncbi:DUF6443 domain-containing protein [Chitinophagaceae bacterium LWZ2-11]